jgi:hypothetical protein
MPTEETGFTDLIDENLIPEAKAARLREDIPLTPQDRLTTPCDKTDVCY